MLKNSIIVIGIVATLACVLFRCRTVPSETAQPLVRMTTKYALTPVEIDGKLDDEAWKNAAVYSMFMSKAYATKYSTPLKELTAVPQLTRPNHHLLEDYAVIEFVK